MSDVVPYANATNLFPGFPRQRFLEVLTQQFLYVVYFGAYLAQAVRRLRFFHVRYKLGVGLCEEDTNESPLLC